MSTPTDKLPADYGAAVRGFIDRHGVEAAERKSGVKARTLAKALAGFPISTHTAHSIRVWYESDLAAGDEDEAPAERGRPQ